MTRRGLAPAWLWRTILAAGIAFIVGLDGAGWWVVFALAWVALLAVDDDRRP